MCSLRTSFPRDEFILSVCSRENDASSIADFMSSNQRIRMKNELD
jgi:hypothetical protein